MKILKAIYEFYSTINTHTHTTVLTPMHESYICTHTHTHAYMHTQTHLGVKTETGLSWCRNVFLIIQNEMFMNLFHPFF